MKHCPADAPFLGCCSEPVPKRQKLSSCPLAQDRRGINLMPRADCQEPVPDPPAENKPPAENNRQPESSPELVIIDLTADTEPSGDIPDCTRHVALPGAAAKTTGRHTGALNVVKAEPAAAANQEELRWHLDQSHGQQGKSSAAAAGQLAAAGGKTFGTYANGQQHRESAALLDQDTAGHGGVKPLHSQAAAGTHTDSTHAPFQQAAEPAGEVPLSAGGTAAVDPSAGSLLAGFSPAVASQPAAASTGLPPPAATSKLPAGAAAAAAAPTSSLPKPGLHTSCRYDRELPAGRVSRSAQAAGDVLQQSAQAAGNVLQQSAQAAGDVPQQPAQAAGDVRQLSAQAAEGLDVQQLQQLLQQTLKSSEEDRRHIILVRRLAKLLHKQPDTAQVSELLLQLPTLLQYIQDRVSGKVVGKSRLQPSIAAQLTACLLRVLALPEVQARLESQEQLQQLVQEVTQAQQQFEALCGSSAGAAPGGQQQGWAQPPAPAAAEAAAPGAGLPAALPQQPEGTLKGPATVPTHGNTTSAAGAAAAAAAAAAEVQAQLNSTELQQLQQQGVAWRGAALAADRKAVNTSKPGQAGSSSPCTHSSTDNSDSDTSAGQAEGGPDSAAADAAGPSVPAVQQPRDRCASAAAAAAACPAVLPEPQGPKGLTLRALRGLCKEELTSTRNLTPLNILAEELHGKGYNPECVEVLELLRHGHLLVQHLHQRLEGPHPKGPMSRTSAETYINAFARWLEEPLLQEEMDPQEALRLKADITAARAGLTGARAAVRFAAAAAAAPQASQAAATAATAAAAAAAPQAGRAAATAPTAAAAAAAPQADQAAVTAPTAAAAAPAAAPQADQAAVTAPIAAAAAAWSQDAAATAAAAAAAAAAPVPVAAQPAAATAPPAGLSDAPAAPPGAAVGPAGADRCFITAERQLLSLYLSKLKPTLDQKLRLQKAMRLLSGLPLDDIRLYRFWGDYNWVMVLYDDPSSKAEHWQDAFDTLVENAGAATLV